MRKIFSIFLCATILMILLSAPMAAHAEEVSDEPPATETVTEPTLFTRVWEYIENNKEVVVSAAGNVILFACAVATYVRNKRRNNLIIGGVSKLETGTQVIGGQQSSVVSAMNNLIENYNVMADKYERYGSLEGARDKYAVAMVTQSYAILEILHTVYANSKNIPQGVKDLINLKYANCLKQLSDDKELLAIADSVRSIIGTDAEVSAEDTEA